MSVRVVVLALVVGSCGSSSRAPQAEADRPTATSSTATQTQTESSTEEPFEQPFSDPPPLSCTMAGDPCPSSSLRQFTTELDADGWARLRARAEQGMIAVALGDRVRLVDACELPGRYHEAAAGPDSPGRAWIGDRLVLLPDEARDCGPATHFVAGFAIRGEADGAAIVFPLPCPPLGSGKPRGCIGAGLVDDARKAAAQALWQQAEPLLEQEEYDTLARAIPLILEMAALAPEAWSYVKLVDALRFLSQEHHGGCSWLAEAAFAAHSLHPKFEASMIDLSRGRLGLSHEQLDCATRPSLLTCFPGRFVPGEGNNCW